MPRQFMDPNLQCYEDGIVYYDYDPDAARAALKASSYGSASNLPKLRVTPRATWPPLKRGMEYAMEQWRKVLGIVNVEFKDRPKNFGADEKKVNISRDDVAARFPDPAVYVFKGTHSTGPIASGSMMRAYKNPKIDMLLDEAMMVEPTHPKRCALAHEAQRLFLLIQSVNTMLANIPSDASIASGVIQKAIDAYNSAKNQCISFCGCNC